MEQIDPLCKGSMGSIHPTDWNSAGLACMKWDWIGGSVKRNYGPTILMKGFLGFPWANCGSAGGVFGTRKNLRNTRIE